MGIAYNTSIVRNGLILHLDAANKKSYPGSGTTWFDLSGNKNNGTITNSPTYNGKSFTFSNASQQKVEVPYNPAWRLQTSATISFFSDGSTVGVAIGYLKGGWDGYMITSNQVSYSGQAGSNDFDGFISKTTNEWCMMTWVIDRTAGFYYLYKNGNLSTSKAIVHGGINSSSGSLEIGASQNVANRYYTGAISDVKFYNRALSLAEVKQNFEALRGRYGV